MPINIPDNLPAAKILKEEKIFVMDESRAIHQDIRPQRIVILNIMPVKHTTETHLLRLLSNTPLQIEIDLIHPKNHTSKNTSIEHLETFYKTFDQVQARRYDGLIITGAPLGFVNFEDVTYWDELQDIMDWAEINVTSTLYLCWGAQAALYHFYGIPKRMLDKKMFGIFKHRVLDRKVPLVRGFDDLFPAPHSRHMHIERQDIEKVPDLEIIAESDEAGIYIFGTKDGKKIFVTGHSEYDPNTLKEEYERDLAKGMDIQIPVNYFLDDDPSKPPLVQWRSHANLLYTNWLNYYVYQVTPFDLNGNSE
ncbi:MAG TPA: homoserine O-succinyltransferase [Bacteroides sp.]|nr:homoserine O-succinyltransferase [Bacteroides sp.]